MKNTVSPLWGNKRVVVIPNDAEPFEVNVNGRVRWALEALHAAGEQGCAPIEEPGPRWSHYIHQLRALGIPIQTVMEKHNGRFPARYARYVLQARISKAEDGTAA